MADFTSTQLAEIQKVKDIIYEKISYTNRDYDAIVKELVTLLPKLSPNWNNISEADIIFIMLSLMAAHKDILNYMIDYRTLEGYMSTAKENASIVRIANSFGYKIPGYKASKANVYCASYDLRGDGVDKTGSFYIEPYTRLVDSAGTVWTYIGDKENALEVVTGAEGTGTVIELYQGAPSAVNIDAKNIDSKKTHILSNKNIAIGNNDNAEGLSRITFTKDGQTTVRFTEVDSVYTYAGAEENIYHLAVDSQGITYVQFLDTFDKTFFSGYNMRIDFLVTQGSNVTSIGGTYAYMYDSAAYPLEYKVNMLVPTVNHEFVLGSKPPTKQQIRTGFKQYYAGVNALITPLDYKKFILNTQKVVDVSKCLVIDNETSTLDGLDGHVDFVDYPGIYVAKKVDNEDGTYSYDPLSSDELTSLKTEIDKYRISTIMPSYNGVAGASVGSVGKELSPQEIVVQINYINPDTATDFKKMISNYINAKPIGEALTSTELLSLIQDSIYAPSYFSNGISLNLVNNTDTVESRMVLEAEYYEYMTCDSVNGIVETELE